MNKPKGRPNQIDLKALKYLLDNGPQHNGNLIAATGVSHRQIDRLEKFDWIVWVSGRQIAISEAGEMELRDYGMHTTSTNDGE